MTRWFYSTGGVLFERLPSLKSKRQPTGHTQLLFPRLRRRLQRAIFLVVRRLYRVPPRTLSSLPSSTHRDGPAMGSRFTGRPHSGNHLRITPMCSVNSSHSLSSFSYSLSRFLSHSLSYSRSYPRIAFHIPVRILTCFSHSLQVKIFQVEIYLRLLAALKAPDYRNA